MFTGGHYVCQRAANAIISEIGPYRVSTDALQAINQFLDSFLLMLVTTTLPLNLSNIKSAVTYLIPSTLGKNAIIEAELETRSFTKTQSNDYELYNVETEDSNPSISLLQMKCVEFCTLADKEDQICVQQQQQQTSTTIHPVTIVFITTIIEHIAEYILNAVAITAAHEGIDYIRVKQVFLALLNDTQLSDLFRQMELKEKLEKRIDLTDSTSKTITTTPFNEETSFSLAIDFDDLELEYYGDEPTTPRRVERDTSKPPSLPSTNIRKTTKKSTFYLFKDNPNVTLSLPKSSSLPLMNFEELIKSGETVKVSLTPDRLKSIEVKENSEPVVQHKTTSLPASKPKHSFVQNNSIKRFTFFSLPLKKRSLSKHSKSNKHNRSEVLSAHLSRVPSTNADKLDARPQTPSSLHQTNETREDLRPTCIDKKLKTSQTIDIPKNALIPLEKSLEKTASPDVTHVSMSIPEHALTTASTDKSPHHSLNDVSLASYKDSIPSSSSSDTSPPSICSTSMDLIENEVSMSTKEPQLPIRTKSLSRRSSIHSKKSRKSIEQRQSISKLNKTHLATEPDSVLDNIDKDENQYKDSHQPPTLLPERPSSIVAKRASMIGDERRKSYHEECATQKYGLLQPVSVSVKHWDKLQMKPAQQSSSPSVPPRRIPLHQPDEPKRTHAVLEKVLKFEQSIHEQWPPRKERYVYLHEEPPTAYNEKKPVVRPILRRVEGIDQGVQTDELFEDDVSERGHIEGDEEWFLNDNEWEEQDEIAVVEWLLGK